MSAGAITGTTKTSELPEDDTVLELTGGENPLTFLRMNERTVMGLIAWMSDPDRIEGWERAEKFHMDTDRDVVLDALERQRRCLDRGDTPPIYHPIHERYDEANDPLEDDSSGDDIEETDDSAADGGDEDGTETEAEDGDGQEATDEDHTEHGHDVHPDADLEANMVLVINHSDTTEFVWPARADADEPYILREFDDGVQIDGTTIGVDEAFRLVRMGSEKRRADSVTVDAPLEAATNRGESA